MLSTTGATGDLIAVRDVCVTFGAVQALTDVSFALRRGEILGLIGPNGAGKTTLFNCLSRLYTPRSGTITLDGEDLLSLRPDQMAGRGSAAPSRTSPASAR